MLVKDIGRKQRPAPPSHSACGKSPSSAVSLRGFVAESSCGAVSPREPTHGSSPPPFLLPSTVFRGKPEALAEAPELLPEGQRGEGCTHRPGDTDTNKHCGWWLRLPSTVTHTHTHTHTHLPEVNMS